MKLAFLALAFGTLHGCLGETEEVRLKGRPARTVCKAAMSVVTNGLENTAKLISKLSVDGIPLLPENLAHPKLAALEDQRINKGAFHLEFKDQNVPTKVVKMNLSEEARKQIIADLMTVRKIEDKIEEILAKEQVPGQFYNPFRLEGDPAVLFIPGCIEFMEDNREKIRKEFPEVHTCQCNAFIVPQNTTPFGFHHASSIGFLEADLSKRRWFSADYHMSFHTALTETNSSTAPMVLFDGEVPAVFDYGYFMSRFRETSWRPDIIDVARLSLLASAYDTLPFQNKFPVYQFFLAAYYAVENCRDEDEASVGTYWNLEPGEALFFNNYRVHSDHRFGSQDHARHTIDLRCLSKEHVPFPLKDESELVWAFAPEAYAGQEKAVGCLLRLFDYADEDDFYRYIMVDKPEKPFAYALGSVLFNYLNPGENGFMSKTMLEGMRKHGRRVRRMYNENSLNYSAFATCVEENEDVLNADTNPFEYVVKNIHKYENPLKRLALLLTLKIRMDLGEQGELFLFVVFLVVAPIVLWSSLKGLVAGQSPKQKKLHSE